MRIRLSGGKEVPSINYGIALLKLNNNYKHVYICLGENDREISRKMNGRQPIMFSTSKHPARKNSWIDIGYFIVPKNRGTF